MKASLYKNDGKIVTWPLLTAENAEKNYYTFEIFYLSDPSERPRLSSARNKTPNMLY